MTADTFSNTLGFLAMVTGNDNNNWGNNANTAVFQIFEDAIANALTSSVTGGTLDLSGSPPPAAASQVRYAALIFTGALGSNQILKVPNLTKWWWVKNATSGAFTLTLQTPSGSASTAIPQNSGWQLVQCDGNNNIIVSPFNFNQVQMPDGSSGVPAYSWLNEPTAGWRRAGTQDYRYQINASDVFQMTGPGASTPSIINVLSPNVLQVNGVPVAVGSAITAATTSAIITLGSITAGSLYTNGTYNNVPLTGGSGSGATANIVVSGGAVTTVTLVKGGKQYTVGNTLSATAASIGGTGSGFSIPVATVGPVAGDLAIWKTGTTIEDGGPAGALAGLNTLTSQYADASLFGMQAVPNLSLSVTHTGGNLLNLAIKTAAGNDPSAASPIPVNFQTVSGSNTTGGITQVLLSSALSMTTFATGANLGTASSVTFRIWFALFNNGGTLVPAMRVCSLLQSGSIFGVDEHGVDSTTAISSGANSAGVWYTPNGTTLANCAYRLIGYCDYIGGLATAGTYTVDPTNVVLFGPGIKKPGDFVQTVPATQATELNLVSGSVTLTNTSVNITPRSAADLFLVTCTGGFCIFSGGASVGGIFQLARNSVSNLFGTKTPYLQFNGGCDNVTCVGIDAPQTTSQVTYYMTEFQSAGIGNSTFWNNTAARSVGAASQSVIVAHEIMG